MAPIGMLSNNDKTIVAEHYRDYYMPQTNDILFLLIYLIFPPLSALIFTAVLRLLLRFGIVTNRSAQQLLEDCRQILQITTNKVSSISSIVQTPPSSAPSSIRSEFEAKIHPTILVDKSPQGKENPSDEKWKLEAVPLT